MSQGDVYEGKVKTVKYLDGDRVEITYHDKITAGNGAKKDEIEGKGRLNLEITNLLFGIAEKTGVPHHTLEQSENNQIIARKLTIFPLEVVVRNVIAGSYARRYGLEEGADLDEPVIEYFVKSDDLNDPPISAEIAVKQNMINLEQLSLLKTRALQLNSNLVQLFDKANMILVDFKLEFGYDKEGNIYLGDELSGDSMRVWDKNTKEKFDKDRFRKDLGDVLTGYNTILERLQSVEFAVDPVPLQAVIRIGPKEGVTNPSGEVTKRALTNSGMTGLGTVSIGKTITVEVAEPVGNEWIHQLHDVTKNLLSNPLIEQYDITYQIK